MLETPHANLENKMPDSKSTAISTAIVEKESKQLPFIIWLILIATGLAIIGSKEIAGYNISGLAWVIPMIFSIFFIIMRVDQISLPIRLWLPWVLILIVYLLVSNYSALQRTAQLICPIIVGLAVSTLNVNDGHLKKFFKTCKKFAIVVAFIAVFKTGLLLTGRIPQVTGLAAEGMTALLLCCVFATSYSMGNTKDLFWWMFMAAFPVYAVTRMAIAVAGITLPLTFGPMRLKKRLFIILLVAVAGLAIFYSSRVQKKMFAYRGEKGTLSDVRAGNIYASGRKFMWRQFESKIKQKPWLGHGTGSGYALALKITDGKLNLPHNDWLLTLHDQGILGTVVYAFCIIIAMFHAWKRSRHVSGEHRLLFLAGSFSFVVLILMMFTDNIMVYASFFGDLQFTILGLAYAADKNINA